jgi:hypothetical protein
MMTSVAHDTYYVARDMETDGSDIIWDHIPTRVNKGTEEYHEHYTNPARIFSLAPKFELGTS